jgi:hypothetical protein
MAIKSTYFILLPFLPLVISADNPFNGAREHVHVHQGRELHGAGHLFQHRAQAIHERDVSSLVTLTPISISSLASGTIVSIITPSPGATPVTVTSQGEEITSYGLYYSICPLGASSETFAPFANLSATFTVPSSLSACSTSYTSIITPICNTVLTGLATSVSVTNCSQLVTFSTAYNYSVETSPTPYVQAITTYFIAGWQELMDGAVPTIVEARECSSDTARLTTTCIDSLETWAVVNVTTTTTTESRVTIAQTIFGPSAVMVHTFRSDITGIQTFVDVDTIVLGSSIVETETISRGPLKSGQSSTSSTESDTTMTVTSTVTRFVEYVSGQSTLLGDYISTVTDLLPGLYDDNLASSTIGLLSSGVVPTVQIGQTLVPTHIPVSSPIEEASSLPSEVVSPIDPLVPVSSDNEPSSSALIMNPNEQIIGLTSLNSPLRPSTQV